MFGSHLSIAGGMHNALLEAERLGCAAVQVFTKNQQQWAAKPLEAAAIKEFRHHADRLGFTQIVAHASYLINLAACDKKMWQKSVEGFAIEMERCNQLGIAYLVVHPGAHCGSGDEEGVAKVIVSLNHLLEHDKKGKVVVCLETTAGQGTCLGCRFEQIRAMLDGIEQKDRVGVCVDTCHILAGGYDIRTAQGMRGVVEEIDRVIGLNRVKAWHVNDSKRPLGSRVDRHEHIGRGEVGLAAFQLLATDPRFRNVPKILETPKEKAPNGEEWDVLNLKALRALAAGKKPRLPKFAV